MAIASIAALGMFIAYIACGIIGRRSSEYGGGTVLLSWIGFFVPCIAWVVLFQTYFALQRSETLAQPQATKNMGTFKIWLGLYLVCMVLAAVYAPQVLRK
jgi:hypothetical protein